jgi:hypothetical protein
MALMTDGAAERGCGGYVGVANGRCTASSRVAFRMRPMIGDITDLGPSHIESHRLSIS